jgi:hypothetical protein
MNWKDADTYYCTREITSNGNLIERRKKRVAEERNWNESTRADLKIVESGRIEARGYCTDGSHIQQREGETRLEHSLEDGGESGGPTSTHNKMR